MKYQEFIPPILARSLNKLIYSRAKTSLPAFFPTYAAAQKACHSVGYEDADLVDTVFEKTQLIKDRMLSRKFPLSDSTTQSLLAVSFSLQHCKTQKQIKVIDFGGACGAHYFQVRPFFLPDVQLDWMVVETAAMVKKAKSFETGELHFVTSVPEAIDKLHSVDLLHSSGALQYVPDPQAVIQELMECQSPFIFLNRLALSASDAFITVQESLLSANGPGALPHGLRDKLCRYPITYYPKQRLEEIVSRKYQIIVEFADMKTLVGDKETFVNSSLFAERYQ